MDVDEEEEGDAIQRLKKVPDFGIEVDFDILSTNEREVSAFDKAVFIAYLGPFLMRRFRHLCRTPLAKCLVNLRPQ